MAHNMSERRMWEYFCSAKNNFYHFSYFIFHIIFYQIYWLAVPCLSQKLNQFRHVLSQFNYGLLLELFLTHCQS